MTHPNAWSGLVRRPPPGSPTGEPFAPSLHLLMQRGDLPGFAKALKNGQTIAHSMVVRDAPSRLAGAFLRLSLDASPPEKPDALWAIVERHIDDNKGCETALLEAGFRPPSRIEERLWRRLFSDCFSPALFHGLSACCPVGPPTLSLFWTAMRDNRMVDTEVLLDLWLTYNLPLLLPTGTGGPIPSSKMVSALPVLLREAGLPNLVRLMARIRTDGILSFLLEPKGRAEASRLWAEMMFRTDHVGERLSMALELGFEPSLRTTATFGRSGHLTESVSWPTRALLAHNADAFSFLIKNPVQKSLFAEDAMTCPLAFYHPESSLKLPIEAMEVLGQYGVDMGHRAGPKKQSLLHRFCQTLNPKRGIAKALVIFEQHPQAMLNSQDKEGKTPLDLLALPQVGPGALTSKALRARLESLVLKTHLQEAGSAGRQRRL